MLHLTWALPFRDTNTSTLESNAISIELDQMKFYFFLLLQSLSIPCFLYIFYQYTRRKNLREAIHYHVIFLLLLISFLFVTIALPLTQAHMYNNSIYTSSNLFCGFWNWLHYSLNIINLFLMGFLSFERNILVFQSYIFRNKRAKTLVHYCPILFCLLYPPIFYFFAIFIYTCENTYIYTELLCAYPCYFNTAIWSTIDLYFNNYTPLLTIPIFCIVLYVKAFLQTRSMRRHSRRWQRNRKMIVQLSVISILYLITWMPLQICGIVSLYWNPDFLVQFQIDYLYLFPYFIHLIYPFIVLFIVRPKDIQRIR